VVSVVDPLLAEAAAIRLGQDLARTETEPALREFVAATWAEGVLAPEHTVLKTTVGEPATAILDTARADAADLIVIGTQGLGGFRKWLLGSTTERLLRRTRVPVLAVPALSSNADAGSEAGAPQISSILAATDFSDSSLAAVRAAVELSAQWSASVTLAHVVAPVRVPAQWQPLVDASDTARVAAARSKLQTLAEQLCGTRGCDHVVVLGDPAEEIGALARDRGTQLIVLGLASARGLFAPRPGSMAYRVLGSSAVPVLVVPATDE
jgi:nucleotide-binding universal stress UspA family protein